MKLATLIALLFIRFGLSGQCTGKESAQINRGELSASADFCELILIGYRNIVGSVCFAVTGIFNVPFTWYIVAPHDGSHFFTVEITLFAIVVGIMAPLLLISKFCSPSLSSTFIPHCFDIVAERSCSIVVDLRLSILLLWRPAVATPESAQSQLRFCRQVCHSLCLSLPRPIMSSL